MAENRADGVACDSDMCIGGQTCTAGVCGGGSAVDCSAMDSACATGTCNPADGSCMAMPIADGTACDTDMCSTGQTCTGGACGGGSAVDCSAMDGVCTVGTCNPADGSCMAAPSADGTACDSDMCLDGQTCSGGTCGGGSAVDCSAFDGACTVGVCDAGDGSCSAEDLPDGLACNSDPCTANQMCGTGTCGGGVAIPALAPVDDGSGAGGAVGLPSIVISEINPGDYIEVFNTTAAPINLDDSTMQLCSPFTYAALSSVGAGITVPAGGYAVVGWPAAFTDVDAGGEVILYANSSFADDTAILDFVCWGTNPHGSRLTQAQAIGKWSGACAAALTMGAIAREPSTSGTTATDYTVTEASTPSHLCVP